MPDRPVEHPVAGAKYFLTLAIADFGLVSESEFIIAVRPDLWDEACRRWGSARVVDLSDVLDRHARIRARSGIFRGMAAFLNHIHKTRALPWMEAIGLFQLDRVFHQLGLYQPMLDKIAAGGGYIRYSDRIPTVEEWDGGAMRFTRMVLRTVINDLRAKYPGQVHSLHPLPGDEKASGAKIFRRLTAWVGGVLQLFAIGGGRKCIVWENTHLPDYTPNPLLLAGVQVTDVALQGPVAGRLASAYGGKVTWLIGQPHGQLEMGECGWMSQGLQRVHTINAAGAKLPQWRYSRFSDWTRNSTLFRVEKILRRSGCACSIKPVYLRYLLDQVLYRDPELIWRVWSDRMKKLNPALLILNSNLFDMACISAWCRRRGIPQIMLPHGFYPDGIDVVAMIGADYMIQFGPIWKSLLRNHKLHARPQKVLSGGMMFLSDLPPENALPARKDNNISYVAIVEGSDISSPLVLSAKHTCEWYHDVVNACAIAGVGLIVRGHPRRSCGNFYSRIADMGRNVGVNCLERTDVPLEQAVEGCLAMIVHMLDTASVRMLLKGHPVIGIHHKGAWPAQARFLRRVAPVAESTNSLAGILNMWGKDSVERDNAWHSQIKALRDFVEIRKDEYRVLIDLIQEIDDEHKLKLTNRSGTN